MSPRLVPRKTPRIKQKFRKYSKPTKKLPGPKKRKIWSILLRKQRRPHRNHVPNHQPLRSSTLPQKSFWKHWRNKPQWKLRNLLHSIQRKRKSIPPKFNYNYNIKFNIYIYTKKNKLNSFSLWVIFRHRVWM